MEYKEFRVIIEDENRIRIIKPSGLSRPGTVQTDSLKERMINIFRHWLALGKITTREELMVLGSYLYNVLFDDQISKELKDEFDKLQKQQSTGLRLVLEFEQKARRLAEMPWEYIYCPDKDREKGFFIATKSRLVLARQVPLNIEVLEPTEKPLRILIVVSRPEGLCMVDADPVIKTIEDLKNQALGAIETDKLPQPTRHSLAEKINTFRPHVLHFIGHGKYKEEGYLALVEDDLKTPHWINDQDLADCFSDYQPNLIFLQACEGAHSESYEAFRGVALQLVYSKVPAVVAMQYPIENSIANLFASRVYQELGKGDPIDVAVQAGRDCLGKYLNEANFSSRAFGSPVVYMQYVAEAKGIIITKDEPIIIDPTEFPCPYPECKGKVMLDDAVCLKCEGKLMLCPKCHKIMPKDKGICRKCGYDIRIKENQSAAESSMESTKKFELRGLMSKEIEKEKTSRQIITGQNVPFDVKE